jgi:hypothetical protein
MTSRRRFLQYSALAGVGLGFAERFAFANLAWAFYQSPGTPIAGKNWPGIAKYVTTLRGIGPGGIPVAIPDAAAGYGGAQHYSLSVNEFTDTLHPTLGPTTLWGYQPAVALGGGAQAQKHLGHHRCPKGRPDPADVHQQPGCHKQQPAGAHPTGGRQHTSDWRLP